MAIAEQKNDRQVGNPTTLRVSRSPDGESYVIPEDDTAELTAFVNRNQGRPIVLIQGLGFVGSAVLAAVSLARNEDGAPRYGIIGMDVADEGNYWKIARVNHGLVPLKSADSSIDLAYQEAHRREILFATGNQKAFELADIVVVDIGLDVQKNGLGRSQDREVNLSVYLEIMQAVAALIRPDCLVIIETTVPPGTCQKILLPLFEETFVRRGYSADQVQLAHSYERVMPGKNYLQSITHFYRVFAACNQGVARKVREFLGSYIDTKGFPLHELPSLTDSEMAKVLENSYRATNIALLQEWAEFAEKSGVDLFEVIRAIRTRTTHQNIMAPGFGVGGYCLTKDPLLADWAYQSLFGGDKCLPLSCHAVDTNDLMPAHTFRLLRANVDPLLGRRILLMGVSYLKDVADTRCSPSELFYGLCAEEGAVVFVHDPLVSYWKEMRLSIETDLSKQKLENIEAVVLAVANDQYTRMPSQTLWEATGKPKVIIDANNVINDEKADQLWNLGTLPVGVGKGHWSRRYKRGGL